MKAFEKVGGKIIVGTDLNKKSDKFVVYEIIKRKIKNIEYLAVRAEDF